MRMRFMCPYCLPQKVDPQALAISCVRSHQLPSDVPFFTAYERSPSTDRRRGQRPSHGTLWTESDVLFTVFLPHKVAGNHPAAGHVSKVASGHCWLARCSEILSVRGNARVYFQIHVRFAYSRQLRGSAFWTRIVHHKTECYALTIYA